MNFTGLTLWVNILMCSNSNQTEHRITITSLYMVYNNNFIAVAKVVCIYIILVLGKLDLSEYKWFSQKKMKMCLKSFKL